MSDDLELLVRESLRARADRVDTTAPLVGRARRAVRRRRGVRAGLAAVALVVAIVGTGVVLDGPDRTDVAPAPSPSPSPAVGPVKPSLWRTEQWQGLVVDVPVDWAWGPAPRRMSGGLYVCGREPSRPYVGRPVMMSDACGQEIDPPAPTSPYVWLGVDLPPGTVDLGGGYVQETVAVAGTTLTVATRDDELRASILASAGDGGVCEPALAQVPVAGSVGADAATVCAYRRSGSAYALTYGADLDAPKAARLVEEYDATPAFPPGRSCDVGGADPLEVVLVTVPGRRFVVEMEVMGCPFLHGGPGLEGQRRLTPALARPWVVGGLGTTLFGPNGGLGGTLDDYVR